MLLIANSCKDNYDYNRVDDFFYLRNDGADMPVYVEGNLSSNTFIVVLHGGPGGDAHAYNSAISAFSDRMESNFVMVYYDQRGSGTSMGRYKNSILTVEQHAEDLNFLINLLLDKYGLGIKFIKIFIRPIIATAIMTLLLSFIGNIFVAVILGASIYFIALFILGTIDKEDKMIFNKVINNI